VNRADRALCVDVLGPLVLRVKGRVVDVPGVRRRALLALLAMAGKHGVSADGLVDALWPDDPPDNAVQALYNHVSRLRGHLGPMADRLERHATGYRLRLEPFELDADAARRFAASDPAAALELWRGPALVEFRALRALEIASVALDELRLQLVDDQLEARLATDDRTVAIDAAAAAAASPLRERTTRLLVRALAADGRTAEAMEAAQAFRRRLADQTGLDPTPALAQLEQRVAAGSVERPPAVRRVAKPDGPMVGRQRDREEVLRLLGGNAVVTLTGPGGVGKTRLAFDIAAGLDELGMDKLDHLGGTDVVVVGLAVVDHAERVCQAVASTLGLRTRGEVRSGDVATALSDRQLLLVLDNCEHVVDACRELVVAVRRGAPGVRVLATSRVTLQVPGEHVVRLAPLPVPRDAHDLDTLRRQPGVRAFVAHARRRRPDYQLAESEAADLVEVLRRLDGLPLGIELAARQVSVMPLRAVRERLDRALDLATGRQGPEDARHGTLRATIDSSYRLLGEEEQRLLRAIAAFPGGVDLATVEALADAGGDPLDLLHGLVDSSLLVAEPETGRYRLLFTVRAFLGDLLVGSGDAEKAHAVFVERCVVVAEEIGAGMLGPDEAAYDARLRAELDNLRAARDLGGDEARVAITLAAMNVCIWRDLREIWSWALEIARDPGLGHHPERVRMLGLAAEAARQLGDFEECRRLTAEAFALAGESTAPALAPARGARAVLAHFEGDFAFACEEWLRAAECPTRSASEYTGSAALAATYAGDLGRARELLDQAHAQTEAVGSGSQIGFLAYVEGELRTPKDPEAAVPYYLEAIEVAARVGCNFVEGVARVSLAAVRRRTGDFAGAADGYGYLIEQWRRTGQTTQLWTTARNAADLLAAAGRTETAALLLICAETAPGVAAVGPQIARFSARAFTPLEDLVDEAHVQDLRGKAGRLGSAGVLDRAVAELREIAARSGI
jgi:predicted ATPase/DNA-binding SARP family transcriptional activator